MNESVSITGIGTVNPLGNDYRTTASHLLAGRNGIIAVTDCELPEHMSRIAGRMVDIPTPGCCTEEEFASYSILRRLMLWCCWQALEEAGLGGEQADQRIGISLGIGAEWLFAWEHAGLDFASPDEEATPEHESLAEWVRRKLHLRGPFGTVAAACASANFAIEQARQWIGMGWCDVCLAGGGETAIDPLAMACFGNLRALSCRNADPEHASRPFDVDRDGFVMGEGGAVFVLESERHARRRGIPTLANVIGFGATSDAHHMVIPNPEPTSAAKAMRKALRDANIDASEVDYVNAHATGTPVGDPVECQVIEMCLGDAVRATPVSSIKSMTGHLLSGAAAINALACVAALEHQSVPPTINLDQPAPDCQLCHVPNEAQERSVRLAVSNSLGFGGSNTSLVLSKAA